MPKKLHTHLNDRASISPCDSHQEFNIGGDEANDGRGDDGQEWEEASRCEEGVAARLPQEKAFEVVPQSDGYDGEVGAQSEHWKHQ